jgi:DNA recombination protein RmuC
MDSLTLIVVALLVVVIAILAYVIVRLRRIESPAAPSQIDTSLQLLKADLISRQAESLLALRDSIDGANRIINERLAEGTSALDRRMSVVNEIENRLGQLSRQAENIETVGKNIQSLSELLRPPRSRGRVGELMLENLLDQILPSSLYETQHGFSDGARVDVVIRIGERLLPIDAKFPMESYERLVEHPDDDKLKKEYLQTIRKHVDAIHGKYIKPDEHTTPFAVMYIPAEAVYYQLVAQDFTDGFDYALSKSVIPSSPGHLYGFLSTISALHAEFGLARAALDRDSRWLVSGIRNLEEAASRLDRLHERMQGSLRSLSTGLEKSRSELSQFSQQLVRLRESSGDLEPAANISAGESDE